MTPVAAQGEVDERRVEAAIASAGRSADVLHLAVVCQLRKLDATGSVLDFGAGEGALAKALHESGRFRRVVAADLVRFPGRFEPEGVEWMQCDLNEELPVPDEAFDSITAVEVIEHLENPRSLAREWFRLLKPGGSLVATTPNNESWRALVSLVFRGHYAAFSDECYPAHITALTRTDLSRILREAGFAPPSFFFSERGALPKLTSVSWQALSRERLRGVRYSDNLGVVAVKPGT
jgi:2-polyprenyl-3-methyl-5-hydroxy-6-metoxy-1,4-benzoquinol methylase